jgi:AraC-like DNA-binding protein
MRHDAGEVSLFIEFMRRLEVLDLRSGSATPCFEQMATDIATLCWPATSRAVNRQSMLAWQLRVRRFVEENLDDPALGATCLARRFAVSARFVHMVFASLSTTAARFVLERRLCAAATALRADPAVRISEVALRVGFSDLSYFCRAFRRRFGTSARSYRRDP